MAYIFQHGGFVAGGYTQGDAVFVHKDKLVKSLPQAPLSILFECQNTFIFPGFVDVHVHLREPGFLYKETMETGTQAAAAGGYTTVCAMPNLNPPPDIMEHVQVQLDAIRDKACIHVHPYGTITMGQQGETLSDMTGMSKFVVGFSDDGKGVQRADVMKRAMITAKRLGKIIVAHCEDNALLNGGYIHDGSYAAQHGHKGICSESEWRQIARDLHAVKETDCSYHVCHVSTKESVALIREAKKAGLDVTCETAPHYLLLRDSMLEEDGRFKMNPPLRSEEDQQAVVEGVLDGTIDMIATDHAPHGREEKNRGLAQSVFGIVGIETAFPLLYTHFVKTGRLSLEQLIDLLHTNPAKRFGIGNPLLPGNAADFTVFDLHAFYSIDPNNFRSLGKSTPFAGWQVYGKCVLTVCGGKIVYDDGTLPRTFISGGN